MRSTSHVTISRMLVLVWLLLVFGPACQVVTIRPLEEGGASRGTGGSETGFDPAAYVDEVWESRVLPTFEEEAIEITDLLAQIADDEEAAIEAHGHRSGTGAYSFMAHGEAQVLEVDTSSGAGIMLLDLAPYDGEPDINMAIGPVIRGNAVRDAVGFIQFNEFENQMEFAGINREMNKRIGQAVLAQFEFDESFVGKSFAFYGAFTLDDVDVYTVTPVRLEEQE